MQVVNCSKQLLLIACGKINHDASKRVKIRGPDFFFTDLFPVLLFFLFLPLLFFAPLLEALGVLLAREGNRPTQMFPILHPKSRWIIVCLHMSVCGCTALVERL